MEDLPRASSKAPELPDWQRQRIAEVRDNLYREIGFVTIGMDHIALEIDKASLSKSHVLILGESGSGKEMVARGIHSQKKFNGQGTSLHAKSCAEIPTTLFEDELFGHEQGAYTDARKPRMGIIEEADGGLLFLDEMGELPKPVQSKLLRVIETGEVFRVGQNHGVKVDVQILVATSSQARGDPHDRIRPDLFHRLAANILEIPPLRDRPPEAKYHLVQEGFRRAPTKSMLKHGEQRVEVDDGVIEQLSDLRCPGNVRQLMNITERVYGEAQYEAFCRGKEVDVLRVEARHITEEILRSANFSPIPLHRHAVNGQQPVPPKTLNLNDRELWVFLETCKAALLMESEVNIRAICRHMRIQPRRFYDQLEKCREFRDFQPTQPKNKRHEFLERLLRGAA